MVGPFIYGIQQSLVVFLADKIFVCNLLTEGITHISIVDKTRHILIYGTNDFLIGQAGIFTQVVESVLRDIFYIIVVKRGGQGHAGIVQFTHDSAGNCILCLLFFVLGSHIDGPAAHFLHRIIHLNLIAESLCLLGLPTRYQFLKLALGKLFTDILGIFIGQNVQAQIALIEIVDIELHVLGYRIDFELHIIVAVLIEHFMIRCLALNKRPPVRVI